MIEKTYQPNLFEKQLYLRWLKNGYFTPKAEIGKPYFSMVTPPPNITGQTALGARS